MVKGQEWPREESGGHGAKVSVIFSLGGSRVMMGGASQLVA